MAIPTNEIHRAKPGVDPKPKHLADGYERAIDGQALCCRRCHGRVGYAEYDAEIEDDGTDRGLVYTVTHRSDCSRW